MDLHQKVLNDPAIHSHCYDTNNRYAYYSDLGDGKKREKEIKVLNFVPTYDKWCLVCNRRDARFRCTRCKTIYFCSPDCQMKAWPIHSRHCGRNQFSLCCCCGTKLTANHIKCEKCPVGYCSQKCFQQLSSPHKDFDCNNFAELFN